MSKKQQAVKNAPVQAPIVKPKSKRTKGWQFEVPADGTSDPLPIFRAVATDPDVQYLAHTVDPESGAIKGLVRFVKPKSSKAFQGGAWQSIKARGVPQRVTTSTARAQLGNRVWAFGTLSGTRKRPAGEVVEADEDDYDEQ
jgi:hypothetical protein